MLGITPPTERSATATEFINQFVLVGSCRLAVVEGLLYRNFGPVRCASRMLSLIASIDRVARSAGFRLVRQRTSIDVELTTYEWVPLHYIESTGFICDVTQYEFAVRVVGHRIRFLF